MVINYAKFDICTPGSFDGGMTDRIALYALDFYLNSKSFRHIARLSSKNTNTTHRSDGVVVRTSASQSVDLEFIPHVESYQKTFKNGIYSFPAWRSAFMGGCGEQAGKFACCVLGQGT